MRDHCNVFWPAWLRRRICFVSVLFKSPCIVWTHIKHKNQTDALTGSPSQEQRQSWTHMLAMLILELVVYTAVHQITIMPCKSPFLRLSSIRNSELWCHVHAKHSQIAWQVACMNFRTNFITRREILKWSWKIFKSSTFATVQTAKFTIQQAWHRTNLALLRVPLRAWLKWETKDDVEEDSQISEGLSFAVST